MKGKISIVALIVAFAALVLVLVQWFTKPKVGYVDLGKLYSSFTMKKEYETKLQQVQSIRQAQLDSLKLDLNVLAKNLQSLAVENRKGLEEQFAYKRQQYTLQSQAVEEENARLTQTYDDEIWKQLNQYIKDFGKNGKYKFIFGAEGSGSLMYADETDNVTEEISAYVNAKYKGQ